MATADRRRHPRINLPQPLRGAVGISRVYLLDLSVGGIRIAHQASLPGPGEFCRVELPTDLGPIKLDCEVVRTVHERALYHTGLQIVSADHQSAERLRSMCVTDDPKNDS
ncbi:MAG TPA: PilZ domain-containing protein [Thermoanaerobaculia bacterium]|nr:PilZ domain-containing protein [Thermoanaerobaculia bacterium]